jgi:hypothetical protein
MSSFKITDDEPAPCQSRGLWDSVSHSSHLCPNRHQHLRVSGITEQAELHRKSIQKEVHSPSHFFIKPQLYASHWVKH